ncbi:uncharacterized protein LOC100178206 [Ciona intestinalis]
MRSQVIVFICLAVCAGHVLSATKNPEKRVMALRDALNQIIDENQQKQDIGCPFHACTAEIMGCPLAIENGCVMCKCARKLGNVKIWCRRGTCMLIPDAGPCKGSHLRFFFDRASMTCQKFIYGGCHGNGNNFETLAGCNAACAPKAATYASTQNKGACMLIPEAGPCMALHVRYYFDRASMQCKKFTYGGCSGNDNNFETYEECTAACSPKTSVSIRAATQDKGVCMLIPDGGPCLAAHVRFYFDRSSMTCQKFLYGGCHGNGNNFETLEECSSQCGLKSRMAENEPVYACPLHGCTPYRLECGPGVGLKTNEHGCTLCECETSNSVEEPAVPCPAHACTAENMGCTGELAKNANGCDLCQCAAANLLYIIESAPVACPMHSCEAEAMGCEYGLAKDKNGCDMCQCEGTEGDGSNEVMTAELSLCQQQRAKALEIQAQVQDGPFVPKCLEDGSYKKVQCYYDECWCVETQYGKELEGTRSPISKQTSMTCEINPNPSGPGKSPGPAPKRSDVETARKRVETALNQALDK